MSGSVLRICAVSLFPDMFAALSGFGVTGRAFQRGLAELILLNPRSYTSDARHTVDDAPYGGGGGMVLKPEPLAAALDRARELLPAAKVSYLSPQGTLLNDALARRIAATEDDHILLCGRYQGIDQRVVDSRAERALSIGEFVVSGGELPAMMFCDALLRHRPGVLGCAASAEHDSFAEGRMAAPCYTRPASFEGSTVPAVLRSGDHAAIDAWRLRQATRVRTGRSAKMDPDDGFDRPT